MARQEYGVTAWGKWFVDVLDSYRMGERINRGRSYANTGKVQEFRIEGRKAIAKVKGRSSPFYKVEVEFPPLAESEQEKLTTLLTDDPMLISEIASGLLSDDFLAALKKHKIELIPEKWDAMKRRCSCPDWGDPCKHQAAVYFVLARQIDSDPQILFTLRGIDLAKFASAYKGTLTNEIPEAFVVVSSGQCVVGSVRSGSKQSTNADNSVSTDIPDKNLPTTHYSPPTKTLSTVHCPLSTNIPCCSGLLTSIMPPKTAFLERRDFRMILTELYHAMERRHSWEEAPCDTFDEHRASRSTWTAVASIKAGAAGVDAAALALDKNALTLLETTVTGSKYTHNIYDAFVMFASFGGSEGTESFLFLHRLFMFVHQVIDAGAFVPHPVVRAEKLRILWLVYDKIPAIQECKEDLAKRIEQFLPLNKNIYADGISAVNILSAYILTRRIHSIHFMPGDASAREREILSVFFSDTYIPVNTPAARSLPLAVWRTLSVFSINFEQYKYRITLKEPRKKQEEEIEKNVVFKLYMELITEDGAVPLKDAARKTGSMDALKIPTALSAYLPEIRALSQKNYIELREERLALFLEEAAPLLSKLGLDVVLPKSIHKILKPRLVLKTDAKKKSVGSSYLNLPALLDWNWQVAVGDTILSAEDYKNLLAKKKSIVRFKDTYISIDGDELARLLKFANEKKNTAASPQDFLKTYLAGDAQLSFDAERIIEKLFTPRDDAPSAALNASLRPYQLAGFRWILSLLNAGFGCILADDMGLGKTVQAIAAALKLRDEGLLSDGCLVVCPAALMENWRRELEKFAPSMRVLIYHGKGRKLNSEYDCFVTTYQTAVMDKDKIIERGFSLLVADEAHLLKNAATKASRTLKELRSNYRLALSGTPVENRLEDMRSLFDFALPGYLGTQDEFAKQFQRPIEVLKDRQKADVLKKITSPFLLRRLKTDKSIIQDLPDKITKNEYASLTPEQAALYENIIELNMKKIEDAYNDDNPAPRLGIIFSMLTALKQICGHPRVYDKESPAASSLSGKAALLLTLLDEALESGGKVLIFSQYVEALECLRDIITKELGEACLLYHGGMSGAKRDAAVNVFQNDTNARILLVSLKAGGLGLNLTAANRVIHYDLWYNPAVEAQATDRAFRIGQKQTVFVHRLITKNSFEEKIDAMIAAKRELAEMTVSTGEAWLSRLDISELRSLFER